MQQVVNVNYNVETSKGQSYFDGGLLQYIGWNILGFIVTVCTFGICFPWALCMVFKWKVEHTVIEGKRLQFSGTAMGLFGNWIKWWLLCIVTFGIYSFWLFIALEKWKTKHTSFQ
ncbi:DUF898 domain-containing protein [Brevibacillus daliensis]|uniref:DUF898 domain-containing protein n=1 Tax=Brevibacillus daliensis TaxID=2892995 RepID=UPI001E3C00B7|nr:DUF898 domain-containing protein [Brevibacillus daliensis]